MKKIILLTLSIASLAIFLFYYCASEKKTIYRKVDMSRNMFYISMLDTLENEKNSTRIIKIMLTNSLRLEIENIGKTHKDWDIKTISPICHGWSKNTKQLILDKVKDYNLSINIAYFNEGSDFLSKACHE